MILKQKAGKYIIKNFRSEKKIIEYIQKLSTLYEFGDLKEIICAVYNVLDKGKCEDTTEVTVCMINMLSKVENMSPDLLLTVSTYIGT